MFIAHRIKYKKDAQQIWNLFILHLTSFLLSEKGAFFFNYLDANMYIFPGVFSPSCCQQKLIEMVSSASL